MTDGPTISVVMCVYNRLKELRKSISSILKQTFDDFELIIIDDGSEEDVQSIVNEFDDERIIYRKLDKNYGVPVARNKGNKIARGDYIAVMDSDDIMFPERLEVQLNTFLQYPDIDVIYSSAWIFRPDEDAEPHIFRAQEWNIFKMLFQENLCIHSTVMHRRKCIQDVSYREDCRYGSDYVFLAELAVNGYKFFSMDKPLIKYNRHKKSITSQNTGEQRDMSQEHLLEMVKSLPEEQRKNIDYSLNNTKGINNFDYEVSFIVPAYNNPQELELTLTKLKLQNTDLDLFEVVVVDDGSDNSIINTVKKFSDYLHIQYFWNPDRGYTLCNVRNAGMKLANGRIFVFLDADVVPEKDMVSKVIALHSANDNLLAIHSRAQMDYDGELLAGEDRPVNYKEPIRMMAGGNISITRDNADMVGGFDTNYNLDWGLEDVDWGMRAIDAGIDIVYAPHIKGYHIGHKTFKNPGKNRYYFHSKWKDYF